MVVKLVSLLTWSYAGNLEPFAARTRRFLLIALFARVISTHLHEIKILKKNHFANDKDTPGMESSQSATTQSK